MARVALIKLFTGLNLGVSQLSGELRRAGHESLMIYFKDYVAAPSAQTHRYEAAPYPVRISLKRGEDWSFNLYKPVTEREYELLIGALRDFRPDLIGFSMTSSGLPLGSEVTARVRQALPVPIIWGGCGPTLERERSLAHADLLCINEGEEIIVELAERIDCGAPLSGVAGVWSLEEGRTVRTPDRPLLSMDRIAVPDFDPSRILHIDDDRLETNAPTATVHDQYVIMTSRGCAFSCAFCVESAYQGMFGKKGSLRRRSVDLVIDELVEARQRFGFEAVQFFDDVFTLHRSWLREFAPRYRAQVGLPFWCYTYPTTTRADDIALLRDAGCVSMTLGIQSGSERLLREHFDRPTPVATVLEAAETIAGAGIDLFVDIITRVDYETEEDTRANVDLLLRLPAGTKVCGFGHMTKFPHYAYSERVERDGQRFALDDDDYAYYHRLYYVALSALPRSLKRAILADPLYRKHPELLDRLVGRGFPTLSLIDPRRMRSAGRRTLINTPIAQSTLPEA